MAPASVKELEEQGRREGFGRLYPLFGSMAEGLRACEAVGALVDASAIDTLLSNFIVPLQSDAISKPDGAGVPRVHCSLNINTETGRLSARRPNLQNQPALEKDRYKVGAGGAPGVWVLDACNEKDRYKVGAGGAPGEGSVQGRRRCTATERARYTCLQPELHGLAGSEPAINQAVSAPCRLSWWHTRCPSRGGCLTIVRKPDLSCSCSWAAQVRRAFRADVAAGKTLIVADYGQLELRILAHMANCQSMIDAFRLGGDFHSRTALGMYDHIKEAIARGELGRWLASGPPRAPTAVCSHGPGHRLGSVPPRALPAVC